jgi:hypothetical protein
MDPTELTLHVLREIRDEIKQTRVDLSARIDATNTRLDATNSRLDGTNARVDRVERRQAESEIRLATELVAVASAVREVRDELRQDRIVRVRIDDHERRIGALEDARRT